MSTETSSPIQLRLHYWNCRGRVQSVRYMLEDIAFQNKNVDYKEEFELLEKAPEQWSTNKYDESISGPFHNLPVLHWNEKHTFGQTLPLARFLAKKFDLYGKLTSGINDVDALQTYIDGVVSCAYTDVISSTLLCIWSNVPFGNPDAESNRTVKKTKLDLKALNDLLKKSSTSFYYDQVEPTVADYFVLEAFSLARDLHQTLMPNEEDYQALAKHEQTMKQRPGLANYFSRGGLFQRFTGSPKESEYMATIRAAKS